MRRLIILAALALPAVLCMGASRTVNVGCTQDLDSIVNNDSPLISTRFQLSGCTYNVDNTVIPRDGDEIHGPTKTFIQRGPAFEPLPTALIKGTPGLDQVMKPQGTFVGKWFRVNGGDFQDGVAGSGAGIAGGQMTDGSLIYAVVVGNNEGAGITNCHGVFDRIELNNNTTNPAALGFTASGIKCVDEAEIRNSYVHDTQGNGIWGDEEVNDTSIGKFYVHHNLVVNNGREGIRWEKVGDEVNHGEADISLNEVHGNGRVERFGDARYGIGARDAQDAVIHDNIFGAKTIAGVQYPANGLGAVRASDSGRADRPDLDNIVIRDNLLRGETITGCNLAVVTCTNNTP
jgi:hypothetical protein